jgi:hypothetical protein
MNDISLHSASFRFSKEGNTLGTTAAYEGIEIRLETQLPGEPPFIVIKTDGFSMDSVGELDQLVQRCMRVFNKHNSKSS